MTVIAHERRPYILSFVGENANGVLLWWTERILEAFARFGFDFRIVDLTDDGWREHLSEHLAGGMPTLCFSFQGFGMGLQLGDENFWSRSGVPFVSYMGDAPYHAPALHAAAAPGLYYIYGCIDFIEFYRDFLGGKSFASIIPFGYPENPHCDRVPWSDRHHPIVYVKTGIHPELFRQRWRGLPTSLGRILEDSGEILLEGKGHSVASACKIAFEQRHVHYGQQNEFFMFACSSVDLYIRAVHAERMVRALLPHDALIIGDWSYLDQSNARARFSAPVPARALDEVYGSAKIVVNTLPSVRAGTHERIVAGQLAKAAIISNTTPFLDRHLSDSPSFVGLDITQAAFGEALGEVIGEMLVDPEMPAKVAISAAAARRRHSIQGFVMAVLEHLQLDVHRRDNLHFSFPPQRAA